MTAQVTTSSAKIDFNNLPETDSEGNRWYEDERLNNWARKNGGRMYGEQTMIEMLESGQLQ